MSLEPVPELQPGTDPSLPLRVSEVANRLERMLADNTPRFWVEAELTKVRAYGTSSFCTLADGVASLNGRISASLGKRIPFKLEPGLTVLALGRLTFRRDRSEIVFEILSIEPRDVGAMQLALEQLKARLAADGLFAEERKRPIPAFATRVGVVTSRQGSVIHDIVTTLERRWPSIDLVLWPVTVQGADAATAIAAGIAAMNRTFPDRDVLLVGRGGGSAEDLAAFNSERVVRAIAASAIPVVSCVGHETDVTLADLVADRRASTPSMAAELVTPVTRAELRERLSELSHRASHALRRRARELIDRVERLQTHPALTDPMRLTAVPRSQIESSAVELRGGMTRLLRDRRRSWETHGARLHGVSPLGVLERGFAVVRRPGDPGIIRNADELEVGDAVSVRVHEGTFGATVTAIEGKGR